MPQPKRQFTTSSLTSSLKSTFANQPLLNNLTNIDKLSSQASSLAQKAPFFGAINQQFQQHYQQQQQNQQQPYNQADGAGAASAKPKQYQQANVSANLGIGGSGSLGNPQTIANGVNEDMFRDVQANNPGSGGRPPPPPPPAVDMSHLTDEERAMIQSVMAKAEMADMGLPVDTSMPSSTNLPSNTSQALTQQRDQQQQKQQQLQQHQKRQQQQLQNNSTMVVTGVGWQGQQQSRQQMDSGNHVQVANQSLQHNQNDALAGMIQQQQQHQMTTQTEQQRLNQTNNMSPSMLDQANRAQDSMHQNQRQVSDATNGSLQLFGQQQQHNFTLNNVVNQALQDQLINQQLATNNNSNQIMREVNNFQQTSDVSSLQENNYSNYLQYNDYYQACSFDQGQQRIVPHHQSQPLNQSSTIQQIVSSPANQQQQLMAMTSFDSRDAGMQLVDSTSQYQNNRTIQAFEQASEIQQWPTTMITTSPMIKSRRGRVASARSTSSLRTIADFEHEHAYSDLDDQRAVESAVQKRNSRSNPAHFKPRRHGSTDEAESRARAKRSRNNISRDVVVGPPRAMLVGPSQFHHDSGIATISGPMSGHRKSSRRLPKAASSSLSNQSKRHVSADCSLQSSSEYLPDERGARSSDRRQELSTTRAKRMVVESVPEKSSSSSRRCKSVDSRRETSTGISRHYPNNHNHNHEQETDSEPEDISFSASDSTSDQQQQQSKPNGEASKTRQNAMVTVKGGASKLSKTGCPDYDKNQEQTLRLLSELKLNEQANQVMEQQQRLIKQSQELIKLQQAQLEQQAEINRTFRVSCLRDSGDMQEMATAKDGGPNQNDPDDKLERKEPNDLGALARLSGKETSSTLQSVSEGIKANDDDAAAAAADNDDNDDERVERSEDKDQNQKCTRDKDADLREGATDGSVTNSRWCDARGSDSSIIGLKRVDYNNSIETDYKPAVGRHKTTTTDKNADTKNSRQQASNNSGHANNSPTVSSRPVHRTSRYDRNLLQSPTDSTTDSDGDLPIAAPRSNSSSSRANRSEHHGHRQSSDQKQQSMARGLSATATTRVKREPRGLPPSPLPVTAAIQLHQMQQRHQKMNQISRPTTSSSYLSRASTHLRSSSVTSLPTTSINYHHVLFDRGDAASRLNSGYMTDDQEQRRRLGRRPISPPDSALSEYGGLVRRRKRLPEPPANVVPVTPSMVRRVVMIGQQANRTPTNALLHSQERFAPNSSSNIRSLHQLALIKPVANSYERNNTDYAGKSLFSHPTTTTTTRSDGFPSTKATTVSALSGRRSSLGYLEQSSSGLLGGLTSDSRLLSGRTFDVPSAASRLTDTDTINRSLSSLDYCNRISKSSEIRNNTTSHLDKYYNLDDGRVIAPLTYSTTNRTEPPSSTVARYNHTNFQTQQQYHPRPPPPRPSPPVIYNPLNSHSSSASTRQQQNEPVSEYPMFQHNPGQYVSDHQPRPRYQQPLASSHPATTLSHDNSYTMAPQPTPPASIASTGTRFQPYNSDGNYRARNNGYGDNSPASTRYSELMGTGHDWHAIDRSAGTIREPYLTVSPHFMSPQSAAQINTPVSLTRRISPDNDADAIASQSNLGRQTSCNNNPVSSASDSSSYNRKIYVVNDDNKQKQALKYDTNDANSQRQHQQATNSISNANHNISSFACPLTKDDIINNGPKYDSIGYRFRTESQNKYVTEQRTPIECLQSKYQYPYKRILLSKNPKDRIGNGIGVRIVGGQPMQNVYDKVNKCIVTSGAFVREVFQSSRVYFMDEMHEGDQIIEWNGVNLCNRSDGEVQQILFSQFSDDEVEIIYLNRDKFFEAYGGDHEPVARFQATEQEELREIDDTFEAFSRINKSASSKVARQLGRGGFLM